MLTLYAYNLCCTIISFMWLPPSQLESSQSACGTFTWMRGVDSGLNGTVPIEQSKNDRHCIRSRRPKNRDGCRPHYPDSTSFDPKLTRTPVGKNDDAERPLQPVSMGVNSSPMRSSPILTKVGPNPISKDGGRNEGKMKFRTSQCG